MFMFTQFFKRMPRCVFESCLKQCTKRRYYVERKFGNAACSTKISCKEEHLHYR